MLANLLFRLLLHLVIFTIPPKLRETPRCSALARLFEIFDTYAFSKMEIPGSCIHDALPERNQDGYPIRRVESRRQFGTWFADAKSRVAPRPLINNNERTLRHYGEMIAFNRISPS